MKKWPVLLLSLLLLTGCHSQENATTAPEDTSAPTESTEVTWPESSGLYAPGSALEVQTDGAVRLYPLENGVYDGIIPMGESLLLLENGDATTVTLLTGAHLTEAASTKLSCLAAQHTGLLQTAENSAAYYDEADRAVVFLNENLRETSRLKLPEDALGAAWLSPGQDRVYYCTADGVQVLDMATGISRLLVEQKAKYQSVTGILLEGEALRCDIQTEDGTEMTRILSTATGETLWEGRYIQQLTTRGKSWLLKFDRGSVTEWVFGARDEGSRNLWPGDGVESAALLEDGSIVTVTPEDWGTRLDRFDTGSGKCVSSVKLAGITTVSDIYTDGGSGVWLLARETANDRQAICHWDTEKTAIDDAAVYTAPHYTADSPDEAGLAEMNAVAARLEEKYGVDILLGADATAVSCGGYGFETEHLVPAMEKYLPQLEKALDLFPEGFLQTAAEKTGSGRLRICLVRAIYGGREYGTLPVMPCAQFWQDGEAYLMIAMNASLEQSVLHAVMHAAETRVFSVCTAYYDWDKLNPSGFTYDNDYVVNHDRDDGSYLYGDSQAFIDGFSKSFAKEDRAQIFAYACQLGNEEYFRTEVMQRKLSMLCDGLRQAFELPEGACIWEQYLEEGEPSL